MSSAKDTGHCAKIVSAVPADTADVVAAAVPAGYPSTKMVRTPLLALLRTQRWRHWFRKGRSQVQPGATPSRGPPFWETAAVGIDPPLGKLMVTPIVGLESRVMGPKPG